MRILRSSYGVRGNDRYRYIEHMLNSLSLTSSDCYYYCYDPL